jgi:hypothetical protein
MLPRRPARTSRTSQIPLEGPPVVPPSEEVGGGVIWGLLVAASTAEVGVGLGEGLGEGLADGLGETLGEGLGVLK